MLRVKGDNLEKITSGARDNARDVVRDTNEEVQRALIAQNERVSFDPLHQHSILRRRGTKGWEIGSSARTYGDVLTVDEDELADILEEHIVGDWP